MAGIINITTVGAVLNKVAELFTTDHGYTWWDRNVAADGTTRRVIDVIGRQGIEPYVWGAVFAVAQSHRLDVDIHGEKLAEYAMSAIVG